MNFDEQLLDIFNDPIFADVKPVSQKLTSNDRFIASFEEINEFYDKYGRLPLSTGNLKEKRLLSRLEDIISKSDKQEKCLPYDRHGLLKKKDLDIDAELESILDDPLLDLSGVEQSLFVVPEHLKKDASTREEADFVARREKCEDFELYRQKFLDTQRELKTGCRRLVKFQEANLVQGAMFVVGGVLVLLNKIFEKKQGPYSKVDGRTHCVFENGTEANLLLRSLARALYLDGYSITESSENCEAYLLEKFKIKSEDKPTGYIYVLKSLSENPEISRISDLYKIGFTSKSVEERISNAASESTYLMDEVEVVASWKTYNLNVKYFEHMIHRLFEQVQLQVKVQHSSGVVITPKEWYVVPISIIKSAVSYIIEGKSISYDAENKVIEEHKSSCVSAVDVSKLKVLTLKVSESIVKQVKAGERKCIEKKIKVSNMRKLTYLDSDSNKRWLVRYDALKLVSSDKTNRLLVVVGIEDTIYDRDSNSVKYVLKDILAVE